MLNFKKDQSSSGLKAHTVEITGSRRNNHCFKLHINSIAGKNNPAKMKIDLIPKISRYFSEHVLKSTTF